MAVIPENVTHEYDVERTHCQLVGLLSKTRIQRIMNAVIQRLHDPDSPEIAARSCFDRSDTGNAIDVNVANDERLTDLKIMVEDRYPELSRGTERTMWTAIPIPQCIQ